MKRKTVISIILTILALSVSYVSYAETTWFWTEVTEDTNNNPTTIKEYELYCNGKDPRIILAPEISYTYNPPVGAEVSCYVIAVDINNRKSAPSNIVTKIIGDEESIPQAPILSES